MAYEDWLLENDIRSILQESTCDVIDALENGCLIEKMTTKGRRKPRRKGGLIRALAEGWNEETGSPTPLGAGGLEEAAGYDEDICIKREESTSSSARRRVHEEMLRRLNINVKRELDSY